MQATLSHYRVLEQIGKGGMGVVYRAHDERLERNVALKVLPAGALADETARKRFRKEALALSKLSHPNIATVFDFDSENGTDFLVEELIPGLSLDEMLACGLLSEKEIVNLGSQLCEGLSAAHEQGIIHRDLKPANIRVTPDGRVKILDFGLARIAQPASPTALTASETLTPSFAGTLPYMAPEQLLGGQADERTDVWAAGCVLYEMATGRRPFLGSGPALIDAILHRDPPAASKLNPNLTPGLDSIVSKCMDKDPRKRYHSAREVAVDLHRLSSQSGLLRYWRIWARRRPRWVAAMATLVAAVLVLVAVVYLWSPPPSGSFSDRNWVLISDFDNTSGDSIFDKTLNEALTISLQQSSYVNVLPRDQVLSTLQRMQRADASQVNETLGREICQRENVKVLLAGSIHRSGDQFQIRVRALDPGTGKLWFTEEQEFQQKEELFQRVDALAARVRRHLGESLPRIEKSNQPLAKVTTRSLEALQLYSRAADDLARARIDSAKSRLQATLALDPNFPMAHFELSIVYQVLGDRKKETEEVDRAYELREGVTERERYFLEAAYFAVHGREQEAAERLLILVNLYPDDADAHFELAMAHSALGLSDKAISDLREVLRLKPYFTDGYAALVLRLAYANKSREALDVYSTAFAKGLKTPKLEWAHGMALLGADRVEESRQVLSALDDDSGYGNIGRVYLARADLYEGKLNAAINRLNRDLVVDISSGNRSPEVLRRYLLARAYLLLGRREPALKHLKKIESEGEPRDLQDRELRWVGTEYVRMGDLRGAGRVLLRLKALSRERVDPSNTSSALGLEGEIQLQQGRVTEAVQSFQRALAAMPTSWAHAGLARAYAQQNDWAAAQQEWRNVLDSKGEILRDECSADWVIAHLELARADRESGDTSQAITHYEHFFALWSHADSMSMITAAQSELNKLR